MGFGFRNAAQTYQRHIDRALDDLLFVFSFMDDIMVASSSPEEHEAHLKIIFKRLVKFHLRMNLEKCVFNVAICNHMRQPRKHL